ncbi:Methionine--tRNA ligase [Babesia sp. Xinjiang]|uniref:Methionine--tRNA ligase n=1 Tax=Babesia sp. Xinjiang TaxID=462227 RepID=UPI000A2176CE|nr:Methionine--tRNA ligase [Babesia sp. Xinjiang]ORM40583.1 Methionine--tRNA ligase [Babesia sp. Xinjiang]
MVAADVIKRYHALLGKNVVLLSGTDEHGTKIENAANAIGKKPQIYVEHMRNHYKEVLETYNVQVGINVHTAVDEHKRKVKQVFAHLLDKGDIYQGMHEGYFSPAEETYYTHFQITNGKSPQGFDVHPVAEKAFFFRLSKYRDALRELISKEGFIMPKERQNEALALLNGDIPDIAVTRSNTNWGVPVDKQGFEEHTIYVWLDALLGYHIDYKQHGIGENTIMLFGKDILRFIALVWPALLMSLGLPLPHQMICHGWLMTNGEKISKSKGEKVFALPAIGTSDVSRFVLLNLGAFGEDVQFNNERVASLTDMVKDKYANLTHRLTGIIHKRGIQEISHDVQGEIHPFVENIVNKWEQLQQTMTQYRIDRYLSEINEIEKDINGYITENQLWEIQDDSELKPHVLTMCQALLALTIYFSPIMPQLASMNLERLQPHVNNVPVKVGVASDMLRTLGHMDFKPQHLGVLV